MYDERTNQTKHYTETSMKQNVQIMIHLYYENQESESSPSQPTRETIKRDLYEILRDDKPLHIEEIRSGSYE